MVRPPKPKRTDDDFQPDLNPEYANIPVEAETPTGSERIFAVLWEIAKTVGFIIIAALLIRMFLIQPFFVQGESMEPSFSEGDYLLINQLSYRLGKPQRGDVVVFKAPPEPETNYIKRVIALPGETIELKNGHFFVSNQKHPQGVEVQESYVAPNSVSHPESEQTRWQLSDDQYFMVGDNRDPGKSSDSRQWGPVPRANFIGKAWLRVYPLHSLGTVKHQTFKELSAGSPLVSFERATAPASR